MEDYVQKLLTDQGVSADVDPEVRQELANELTARINDFLNRRLLDAMSDSAVKEFEALMDSEQLDANKVHEFVAANVPNVQEVTNQALFDFRLLYLGEKA